MLHCKTDRIRDELDQIDDRLGYLLMVLAQEMACRWQVDVVVTDLLRTAEEQAALYPEQPGKRSVHEYGRGADVRVSDWPQDATQWAINMINLRFPYGPGFDGKPRQAALVHDVGHVIHLHLQVPPREVT